jgi:hypothetical protein
MKIATRHKHYCHRSIASPTLNGLNSCKSLARAGSEVNDTVVIFPNPILNDCELMRKQGSTMRLGLRVTASGAKRQVYVLFCHSKELIARHFIEAFYTNASLLVSPQGLIGPCVSLRPQQFGLISPTAKDLKGFMI